MGKYIFCTQVLWGNIHVTLDCDFNSTIQLGFLDNIYICKQMRSIYSVADKVTPSANDFEFSFM